jgi:hypothetical protein
MLSHYDGQQVEFKFNVPGKGLHNVRVVVTDSRQGDGSLESWNLEGGIFHRPLRAVKIPGESDKSAFQIAPTRFTAYYHSGRRTGTITFRIV